MKIKLKPPDLMIVSILTLVILFLYTYTYFFVVPYLGIDIQMTSGVVMSMISETTNANSLKPGDVIITAGDQSREEIISNRDRFQPLFGEYQIGDTIQFTVNRSGEVVDVEWEVPGPSIGQVWGRFFNLWWMAYIFWGFGLLTLRVVHIRDIRWRLLIWYYNLGAIWIIAGVVSTSFVFYSSLIMHAISWLLMAVMLHLHWVFPEPLMQLDGLRRYVIGALYILGTALGVAEFFQLLPWESFLLAIAIALLGSLVLLLAHYWIQPRMRWSVRMVMAAIITLVIGTLVFAFLGFRTEMSSLVGGGILFAPLIPAAYFYAIMRHRLGRGETLLNRFVVTLVFGIFLLAIILILVASMELLIADDETRLVVGITIVIIAGFVASFFYGPYRRGIESRFLGIQHSLGELVQSFGQQLVTRLTLDQLVCLLSDEIMPSLGINQSALLRVHGINSSSIRNDLEVLYAMEVNESDLPTFRELVELQEVSGTYRPPPEEGISSQPCPWVRLALPLKHEGEVIGICLMGEREPDDFYSYSEIPLLQTLIDQTSLALVNIEQANLLLELSRREIAHRESERRTLAHELHDEVLAQMAVLAQSMSAPSAAFTQAYQDAVQRIRDVISGLRPATLEQLGLHTALEELLDDLTERSERSDIICPALVLDLTPERRRYDRDVELHLFRIVQQASYNVLEHAKAEKLVIRGQLTPEVVELEVVDDGVGFQNGNPTDFGSLLAHQHFGLVTMHERASLIGARVEITSKLEAGTRVKVSWRVQTIES